MKRIVMILMEVALVALPTMAQNYGEQDQPKAQFQSTSTMTPSGSAYSATPTLNENGVATAPSAARTSGGPRKNMGLPTETPTPDASDQGNLPVGDAVLPLTLIALAFCGVIALRRRRSALNR